MYIYIYIFRGVRQVSRLLSLYCTHGARYAAVLTSSACNHSCCAPYTGAKGILCLRDISMYFTLRGGRSVSRLFSFCPTYWALTSLLTLMVTYKSSQLIGNVRRRAATRSSPDSQGLKYSSRAMRNRFSLRLRAKNAFYLEHCSVKERIYGTCFPVMDANVTSP